VLTNPGCIQVTLLETEDTVADTAATSSSTGSFFTFGTTSRVNKFYWDPEAGIEYDEPMLVYVGAGSGAAATSLATMIGAVMALLAVLAAY